MKGRSRKKIIIIGGLGNGSVIAAAIIDANKRGIHEWVFYGYLNDRLDIGELIDGFPIVGKLSDIEKFLLEDYYFINTIYRIDGQEERINLFEQLNIPDDHMPTFIHPTAYVAPNVVLGPGSVVMPHVSISPGTTFGKCNLIMVNASIGHNNEIGDYCHFAANCSVGAYLKIGDGVHIGLNASVKENLTIGKYAALGMGAVLTKNIAKNEIWVGSPAKFLRRAE